MDPATMISGDGTQRPAIMSAEAELVSVIIPTFNSARFVLETLHSVLAQHHRPIQLLVVDDGSSDDTGLLVEKWIATECMDSGIRGRLIRQHHRGGAAARNLALASATGKWIQFLDSDDLIAPNKIASQLVLLRGDRRLLAYCPWRFLEPSMEGFRNGELRQTTSVGPEEDPLKMHIEGWYCPLHCYLWPRDLLLETGGFDQSLSADQDGDLLMRALIAGARLAYCGTTEVGYRMHSVGQVSRGTRRSQFRSRLRVARRLSNLLRAQGMLDPYRESIAIRCDDLERSACFIYPELATACRATALGVCPGHRRIVRGGRSYRLGRRILGFRGSEWVSFQKRRVIGWWRAWGVSGTPVGHSARPSSRRPPEAGEPGVRHRLERGVASDADADDESKR